MKHFLICILMILVACNKQPSIESNSLTITAFSTDFETKASETAFEAGDKIGVFLENNASNLRYETADGSTWNGFGNIGEFKSGDNVIAYYPYSAMATNQSAIEVSSGVDFMITAKTPITVVDNKASATLKFKHILSKLVAKMAMPEEIAGIKTVSLDSLVVKNVFRKGVIDIATEKITQLTDRGDVVLKSGEAIIIPQTISRIEFIFKMANGTFMKQVYPENLLLESGKKTTLNAVSNADLYFTSTLDLKSGEAQTNLPLSFYVAPGRTWTLKSSETWLAVTPTSGTGAATVKVNVQQNAGVPRTATITLTDDKQAATTQSPMQHYVRTVTIAGTKWTTRNLTGTYQGQTTGFTLAANPQGLGFFWKWGTIQAYDRSSGNTPSGHWANANIPSDYTRMGATYPITQSRSYDYANVSTTWSGATAGDPCQSLGSNYKTPTLTQIKALHDSGRLNSQYQDTPGWFFGPSAGSCNNTTLKADCIFLPMAGYRDWSNGSLNSVGTGGWCWSSSVYDVNSGWNLGFNSSGGIGPENNGVRSSGLSVRCVQE